tara:strand:- start:1024 stop:1209 length:186 start_codon:yes stop_codon:yes gene_type:complete
MDKVWKWDDKLTPYQNFSYWLQLTNEERYTYGDKELSFTEGKKIFEEMYEMKFDFTENDNE